MIPKNNAFFYVALLQANDKKYGLNDRYYDIFITVVKFQNLVEKIRTSIKNCYGRMNVLLICRQTQVRLLPC